MNRASTMSPTTGRWWRQGTVIVLDDPIAGVGLDGETGPSSGPPRRRRGMPSSQQLDLLRQFLGSGLAGARARLANFAVPAGLRPRTLRWYRLIAQRALADPAKATPAAQQVQRLRIQLVERALQALAAPSGP